MRYNNYTRIIQKIKFLKIANGDIQSVVQRRRDLEGGEAARTFQRLSNNISEVYMILSQFRSSCKEERVELANCVCKN
jgi:hypothetical protein